MVNILNINYYELFIPFENLLFRETNTAGDRLFSMYAKFPEKLTFLTP